MGSITQSPCYRNEIIRLYIILCLIHHTTTQQPHVELFCCPLPCPHLSSWSADYHHQPNQQNIHRWINPYWSTQYWIDRRIIMHCHFGTGCCQVWCRLDSQGHSGVRIQTIRTHIGWSVQLRQQSQKSNKNWSPDNNAKHCSTINALRNNNLQRYTTQHKWKVIEYKLSNRDTIR